MPPLPDSDPDGPREVDRPRRQICPECRVAGQPEVLGVQGAENVRWLRCARCGHVWSEPIQTP